MSSTRLSKRSGSASTPEAGASEPKNLQFEAQIAQLQQAIERFRIEAEQYFNGALKVPPEESRNNIQRLVRYLQDANLRSSEQFRVSNLAARWNTFNEIYGRRLREREEGRTLQVHRPAAPVEAPKPDPFVGVELDRRLSGPGVEVLYQELVSRSGARIDLETFRQQLARQLETLRAKTGTEGAIARLAQEDGKWKLKLKPRSQ